MNCAQKSFIHMNNIVLISVCWMLAETFNLIIKNAGLHWESHTENYVCMALGKMFAIIIFAAEQFYAKQIISVFVRKYAAAATHRWLEARHRANETSDWRIAHAEQCLLTYYAMMYYCSVARVAQCGVPFVLGYCAVAAYSLAAHVSIVVHCRHRTHSYVINATKMAHLVTLLLIYYLCYHTHA